MVDKNKVFEDMFGKQRPNTFKNKDTMYFAREIEYRPGHYYPKGTFHPEAPSLDEDNKCICGEYDLDNAGPECYSHMSQGY